jgi:hypothetical protein
LQCTLLVYVHDATRRLMTLHFTATESTFSHFEATRPHLASRGKPVAFCSDKYSVFRKTGGEQGWQRRDAHRPSVVAVSS